MRPPQLAPLVVVLFVLALAPVGCSDPSGEDGTGTGEVEAVATTTIAGDFIRAVGGEGVRLDTLVPAGSDPHDHEPRPSDAAALAEAELVIRSGGDLDQWLDDLIENAGAEATELTLMDSVRTIGEDPHWWQDPRNAVLATEAIRDALVEADPEARRSYRRNADAYVRELRALDRQIERCLQRVPAEKRRLVTTHDSLGYFAARYDVEVIGSVIPSLSTQAQPSAKDVEALVEQIEEEGVEAIFPEAAVSQRLEKAIARESGAEVGDELWTDSLGGEGSGAETYLDAMRVNADALAEGMSGGRVSCGR
jgi:ABC-type Zn uptake system ZnuABC Zn-binding protein ZnuA